MDYRTGQCVPAAVAIVSAPDLGDIGKSFLRKLPSFTQVRGNQVIVPGSIRGNRRVGPTR